jgi:hypothetical protein
VTAFRLAEEEPEPLEFMLGAEGNFESEWKLLPNGNLPQLLAVTTREEFWVVNLNTLKLIKHGRGTFFWKEFDEYLLISQQQTSLHSLSNSEPLLTVPSQHSWS